MPLTPQPASCLSKLRLAVVSMRSGVIPALPSSAERAMEKQPACAAAISSSGLVPLPFSNRVVNEYWVLERTPLSVETMPLPPFKSPCQTADAFRVIIPPDALVSKAREDARPPGPNRCERHIEPKHGPRLEKINIRRGVFRPRCRRHR